MTANFEELPAQLRRRAVISEAGCWNWTGYQLRGGYGHATVKGKKRLTHRASWEALVGPIPEGLDLDHLCRNGSCINPEHLEPVTPAENQRRRWVLRTTCVKGHAYTPENTGRRRGGYRVCRRCDAIRHQNSAKSAEGGAE